MDSEEVIFEYTGKELNRSKIPEDMTILRFHPSITNIATCSFTGFKKLREVVLHDCIVEIGKYAFAGCTSLESIAFPSTMIKIGTHAFDDCPRLRNVILNEGLREIGNSAFIGCTSLEHITIPSTVTEIDNYAFSDCTNLSQVVLNIGLKKIGFGAFHQCSSLITISLPSTVIEIDEETFFGCNSLREVEMKDELQIQKIGKKAFEECALESIRLPSSLTEIGEQAFWFCQELREIELLGKEIRTIGKDAFGGCRSLERFKFPSLFTRLNSIIQAGQRDIEVKMDDIPAVEWRGGELSIPPVRRFWTEVDINREKLNKIVRLIEYYELQVATSLFELALWKAKLDQSEEASDINREAYRIEVPGPVKDSIMQYIGKSII